MKKVLLIIGLLLTVTIVITILLEVALKHQLMSTLEIMYDSKKCPHKIVIYSRRRVGMAAVDLDANTYK